MIIARISDGKVPVVDPVTLLGDNGSGTPCRVCEQPVQRHQIEYEVTDPEGRLLSFHQACQAIWPLECRARSRARKGK